MCDVLFVIPSREPSMSESFNGTLLLATILKQNDLNVDIYRFYEADKSKGFFSFIEETSNNILSKKPKIVSFYCRCDCYLADIMISKRIKELSPQTYIVFGGPQADASSHDTLNEISWVDFCCRGEGETTVYPLFNALLTGGDYTNIDGLSYRDNQSNIIENPVAPLIEDLDSLPFIDYSFIPSDTIKTSRHAQIDVGRGCPFKCAYCSTSLFWQRKFRIKSPGRIIAEMNHLYKNYGIQGFGFEHDLFTANKKYILEFTNALQKSDFNFSWSCSSRVDTLDDVTIKKMAQNGLKAVFIGVESGSERMQKLMNKNLKVQDVIDTVTALVKNDIKITASFMYGFPEETEDDIEKTLQLAYNLYKLGVSTFQFHLCSITSGTPYFYQYYKELTPSSIYSNHVGNFGISECQDFIQKHSKLFSYFYEYKSETRNRFSELSKYALDTILIYDKFTILLPEEYNNKRISDLLLEIIDMYKDCRAKSSTYEIAIDYINSKYSGKTLNKLKAVFSYYQYLDETTKTGDFITAVEYYPIDIQAVNHKEPLDNISFKNTIVYFNKTNNNLSIKTASIKNNQ